MNLTEDWEEDMFVRVLSSQAGTICTLTEDWDEDMFVRVLSSQAGTICALAEEWCNLAAFEKKKKSFTVSSENR